MSLPDFTTLLRKTTHLFKSAQKFKEVYFYRVLDTLPRSLFKISNLSDKPWYYLEKKRRRRLKAIIYMRELRKWNFQLWDIRINGGIIIEEYFTLPVISLIQAIIEEYGEQESLYEKSCNLNYAIFQLTAHGIISNELRQNLENLNRIKKKITSPEKNPSDRGDEIIPASYFLAKKCILELDQNLSDHYSIKNPASTRGQGKSKTEKLVREWIAG